MQWVKDLVKRYEKGRQYYLYEGEEIFQISENKLYGFVPSGFVDLEAIEYLDEIESLPFNWKEQVPEFRFKVLIKSKPPNSFIRKYEKYLTNLDYNKEQQAFHMFPNSLLKKWKIGNHFIWDLENKKWLQYREDYFVIRYKKRIPPLFFLECFARPIENELVSIINGQKNRNFKFIRFFGILFKLRIPFYNKVHTAHLGKNIRKYQENIDNYKDLEKYDFINSIMTDIQINQIYDEGITNDFQKALIHPLSINIPLTSLHFKKYIYKDHIFLGIATIAPNKILVLFNGENDFKPSDLDILVQLYLQETFKGSKWALYNEKTNKMVLNRLKNVTPNITGITQIVSSDD